MPSPRKLLPEVIRDLDGCGQPFALVGALAVGIRSEERHTRDIDFAVSTPDAKVARDILRYLIADKHYLPGAPFEDIRSGELRGATLFPPGSKGKTIPIDLLFSTCGIEQELVARSDRLEILPEVFVNVATRGDLIAMKVLCLDDARRPRDRGDLAMLLKVASASDVEIADKALAQMEERGYGKALGKDDLRAELDQVVALYSPQLELDRGPTL